MSVSKILLINFLISLAIFMPIACKTVTQVKYEHQPSALFYRNFNINANELNDFKAGEILFVVNIKKVTHSNYMVWLNLYSDKAGLAIDIERAEVSCSEWGKRQSFNRELALTAYLPEYQVFKLDKGLRLFELDASELPSVLDINNEVSLTVFYDVGSGTESKTFKFQPKIEEQLIFPT